VLEALRCPTCSAPIAFARGASVATCAYCRAEVRDLRAPPAHGAPAAHTLLDETLALGLTSGQVVPLVPAGTPLPLAKDETLSTARDGQPSIAADLCTAVPGGRGRSLGHVEVLVGRRGPRGVPRAVLHVEIDVEGTTHVSLEEESGASRAHAALGRLATRPP
jgi:hypothetical protein